ncbi:MAG: ABC transporter ATP-binding protein [Candidatus Aminicenantes bacterium]
MENKKMNALELKNVFFSYKKTNFVINDLDLTVKEGEIHGLLGHNGAGKTTILRLISGLLEPSRGSVTFFENMTHKSHSIDFISYMPETIGIYEKLNSIQNLEFRGLAEGLSKREIKQRSRDLLKKLGLNGRKKELAGYLSHGLRKRLSLSCALVKNPRVLLLDEPTNGIDPASLKIIIDLLKDLNKNGATILISSHDLATISRLCTAISILQEGKIVYGHDMADVNLEYLENMYLEKTGAEMSEDGNE